MPRRQQRCFNQTGRQVHGKHSHFVPGQLAPAVIIFKHSVQVSTFHELSHQHCVLIADTDAQEANNVLCPHLLQDCHLPSANPRLHQNSARHDQAWLAQLGLHRVRQLYLSMMLRVCQPIDAASHHLSYSLHAQESHGSPIIVHAVS